MSKIKWTLQRLEDYDINNDTSIVRELEMTADAAIDVPGYSIQFWHDVALYGIDEAILYVKNQNVGDAGQLLEKWNEIKLRITGN